MGTPVDLEEGTVEPIEPQASLSITPVRGEIEVIEPSPSADVIPAELLASDRTEPVSFPGFPLPEFPDDFIVLPVDEDDGRTAPPGPGDVDEVDTTTPTDDELAITKLPEAGSTPVSTGRSTITIAVGWRW